MTADGPKIIDWVASFRTGAALDLGRSHLLLSELVYAPEGTDSERPRSPRTRGWPEFPKRR